MWAGFSSFGIWCSVGIWWMCDWTLFPLELIYWPSMQQSTFCGIPSTVGLVTHCVTISSMRCSSQHCCNIYIMYCATAVTQSTPPPPAPQPHRSISLEPPHTNNDSVEAAIKDIRLALQRTKTLPLRSSPAGVESLELTDSPIWVPRWVHWLRLCMPSAESTGIVIMIPPQCKSAVNCFTHVFLQETNWCSYKWGTSRCHRATQSSQWRGWRWGRWAGTSLLVCCLKTVTYGMYVVVACIQND